MIPCKQCLKFPICLTQTAITCADFHDYFTDTYRDRKEEMRNDFKMNHLTTELQNNAWDYAWDRAKETLPNATGFYRTILAKQK